MNQTASPIAASADRDPPCVEAPPMDPHEVYADALQSWGRWFGNLSDAAGAITAALFDSAATKPAAAHLPEADPAHLSPVLLDVARGALEKPEAFVTAQSLLLQWAIDCGRAGVEAVFGLQSAWADGDRRFADGAWNAPVPDLTRRIYGLSVACAQTLVREAPLSDPRSRRQLEFFTSAALDALAPTNHVCTNPVAWEELIRSEGASLARGARSFAEDLKRGAGALAIRQTDLTPFKLGENIAATPGKVVFRNTFFELIQYSPATADVREIPLLIVTPWINKYYIVDLQPANSLVRWLTEQGFTVFVTSWVNPDAAHANTGFEDYVLRGVLIALGKVLKQTGQAKANVVGYCIGGTALACAMAYLAARNIASPIQSATFFAAQQDFSEAGDLLLFSDEAWLAELEGRIDRAGGVLPGQVMAATFNQLRANDLIWSPFVDNYLLGRTPRPFDLLFWNADCTRLPKRMGLGYVRDFYQRNRFARGELVLDGVRLDLSTVTTPAYVQAAKEDHIAPFASVYRGARLFGGPVTFMLAGSGHIAGVINPPAKGKYQHWVNPGLPESHDEWLETAQPHPGSWWPHWRDWLETRSGGLTAARDPAAGPLPPLADAPGKYVFQRS